MRGFELDQTISVRFNERLLDQLLMKSTSRYSFIIFQKIFFYEFMVYDHRKYNYFFTLAAQKLNKYMFKVVIKICN